MLRQTLRALAERFSLSHINRTKIIITALLTLWFGWYFVHPIDLLPADLGRHIVNGRILLNEPDNAWKLLHTNFYSFAAPNAPFINHHWLTGIVFYFIWNLTGFVGLGVFHLCINLVTFLLFFRLAIKRAGFKIASLVAICTIPLLAERAEIRPEIFSYFLSALYLTILSGVTQGTLKRRWLTALIPLQILWINLHIYFFLGFGYIGAYWLATIFKKTSSKQFTSPLFATLMAAFLASLFNPNGWRGLLYPTQIFQNYGFVVSENQSVFEYVSSGNAGPTIYAFVVFSLLLCLGLIHNFKKRRFSVNLADTFIVIFIMIWTYGAVRNIALFGYCNLVLFSEMFYQNKFLNIPEKNILQNNRYRLYFAGFLALAVLIGFSRIKVLAQSTSLGIVKNNLNLANFVNKNNITGPLFNDFDIGGYAILNFFPRLAPFVDNRPEAYPANFITETYVPMQTQKSVWTTQLNKYNFNAIIYSFQDRAPWATTFILTRLADPEWAPVFADNFGIVFLRRNPGNADLIAKFEMSRDRFGYTTK